MNRSVQDVGGGLLLDERIHAGRRRERRQPAKLHRRGAADDARQLYDLFMAQARAAHPDVATGIFAADMKVHLVNDGPVTIPLQIS